MALSNSPRPGVVRQGVREAHRRLRQSIPAYILEGSFLSLLTAPVIYSLLLPFVILDVWVTLYQSICLPIYRNGTCASPPVFRNRSSQACVPERDRKGQLHSCSYANGLLAYAREVGARTEQYWCPIKHARAVPAPHPRYHVFLDYGDASGYRKELSALRHAMKARPRHGAGKRRKAAGHVHGGR
jgi:hypothetical protein